MLKEMVRIDCNTFSSLKRPNMSSELDFFMNIMPQKIQFGADMQSLPKAPQ